MKIAVAQIKPVKGNISANIITHKNLISVAVSFKADAIFFPELSITGYEPGLAKELAITADDKRLDEFQQICDENKITIGVGVPTKAANGTLISMIIFQPGKSRQTYSKQQLHSEELPYFVNGNHQIIVTINDKKLVPAICFESLQPDHAAHANVLGADLYIASVAKSQNGVDKAQQHYPGIANKYSMPVLMANLAGYCDNFKSVGKSAIWNNKGEMMAQLDDENEGLLIFDTATEEVIKKNV